MNGQLVKVLKREKNSTYMAAFEKITEILTSLSLAPKGNVKENHRLRLRIPISRLSRELIRAGISVTNLHLLQIYGTDTNNQTPYPNLMPDVMKKAAELLPVIVQKCDEQLLRLESLKTDKTISAKILLAGNFGAAAKEGLIDLQKLEEKVIEFAEEQVRQHLSKLMARHEYEIKL